MKNLFYSILLFAVVAATTSSCKKDDPKPSKTDLIAAKTWTQTKVEITSAGVTADVTSSFISDCDKDDTYVFTKDGKFTQSVGANLCDPDDTNTVGTWAWKTNETILSVTTPDGNSTVVDDLTLVDLSSTTLKVSEKETDSGVVIVTTITFTGK